jgi:hypothetical protein
VLALVAMFDKVDRDELGELVAQASQIILVI